MKPIQLFVAVLLSGALAACGGGSTGSPGPGALTVSPATASVAAGSTQLFTVSGGSGGSTTWNASVGTITNGGLYTAPAVPPISQPVSITATQGSVSGSASATVTYSNQSLNGPFTFIFSENQGVNVTNAVGIITADGNGNISGTEDVNTPTNYFQQVAVSGNYSLSANGQGTLTINGGAAGTLILTLSLVAGASEGILSDATSGRIGVGSLFPQTGQVSSGADLNGNFTASFGASGLVSDDNSLGILALSTPVISGSNFDENNGGAYTLYNNVSGSYAVVSSNYGTFTLTLGGTTYDYVFYAVSPDQLVLMCMDANCTNTGELDSQSAQSVTSGNYVFLTVGNGTGQMPDAFMAIGSVTSTSATTGSMNLNMFENNNGNYLSITNGTTYTLDATGRGMTQLPTPNGLRNFVFNVQSAGSWNLLETSSGFGNTSGFSNSTQGTATIPSGQYVFQTLNQVPGSTSLGTTQGILQIGASGQVTGQEQINTNGTIITLQVSGTVTPQNVAGTYAMTLNLGGGQTASYVLAVVVPGDMTALRTDNSAVEAGGLIIQYQTQ
ncbi:MAG: hypothetical protein ACRETA_00555 [Gammaproteobacteria bacterium]